MNKQQGNGMNFGEAIAAAQQGKRIARAGWNGKGMFVYQMPGYDVLECNALTAGRLGMPEKTRIRVLPYFAMKTADVNELPTILPGWLASQTDMLATDWSVVE